MQRIKIYLLFYILSTINANGQVLEAPVSNYGPGTYVSAINVSLSHSEPGVTIFYTLNGSEPGPGDNIYTSPISMDNRIGDPNSYVTIPTNPSFSYPIGNYTASRANNRGWLMPFTVSNKINVLRFRAYKPGFVPSETITHTYIIDEEGAARYSMPIVSFVMDSLDMFSNATGIYVYGDHPDGNYSNKGVEWERIGHFEYFDNAGNLGYAQETRTRIHGGGSRQSCRKNLRLYGETGSLTNFTYPFFDETTLDKFKRIMIRGGGHRPDCFPRDDLANFLTQGLNADQQHFKHVIVFVNGEYWGVHAIRERVDKYFLQNQFGIDDNLITILDQEYDVQDGHAADSLEMASLENFITINDMSDPVNFQYVENRVDIDNYIDYMCAEIFLSNEDWVYSNVVIWRKTGPFDPTKPKIHDGKFRWIFYDLDGAFGGSCDAAYYTVNTLNKATVETGIYTSYSRFFRGMLENPGFKNKFISRMSDLTNSWFKPTVSVSKINEMHDHLTPEMPETVERWRYPSVANNLLDRSTEIPSLTKWEEVFSGFRSFATRRGAKVHEHIMAKWGYTDTSFVNIDVNDIDMGLVKCNTLLINEQLPGVDASVYPWVGRYINGIEIPLIAIPMPGYEFVEWLETGNTNDTIYCNPNSDTLFTAIFQPSSNYSPILINEVMVSNSSNFSDNFGDFDDWAELFNPNNYAINISNCLFERDGLIWRIPNETYIKAQEYKIFWYDNQEFQGIDHANFKLPNGDHTLIFKDSKGNIIDFIDYPNSEVDHSYGRYPNASSTFASFSYPTPQGNNNLAGVEVYDFEELTAFPNPTNGMVHLSRVTTFVLYDLNGKIILNRKEVNSFDTENLNQGIYILQTSLGESLKIIVY